MSKRHAIIPAVWMIIRDENQRIFLLRRFNTGWRDGWYTVPAGHVEPGESPTTAAIRELEEEAGVVIDADALGDPLIYIYPSDDLSDERVSLFYEVSSYSGTPRVTEPHKADQGEWFEADDLPDKLVPILRLAINDIRDGVRFSDRFYEPEQHALIQ